MSDQPRLLSGAAAAAYCGLKPSTFSAWVAAGRLPKPLPGTRRWDRKALDQALDALSGIAPAAAAEDPFEEWERKYNARNAEEEWERKYDERNAEDEWKKCYAARKAAEGKRRK